MTDERKSLDEVHPARRPRFPRFRVGGNVITDDHDILRMNDATTMQYVIARARSAEWAEALVDLLLAAERVDKALSEPVLGRTNVSVHSNDFLALRVARQKLAKAARGGRESCF